MPDPATGRTHGHFAVGRITYPKSDQKELTDPEAEEDRNGYLIYLRSTLTDLPPAPDLESYGRINRSFPSDTTTDLFFDEAQFEAYGAPGYLAGRTTFRDVYLRNASPLADFVNDDDFFAPLRWAVPSHLR